MDIWKIFDEKNNVIKEYKYWKLLLRKKQVKLGSCVAILKRDAFPLSKVTKEEMVEYVQVTQEVERALAKAFKPDLVNHLALMFFDKHIHFHIITTYKEPRKFAGMEWVDDYNPDPLVQQREQVSQEILNKIKEEIKKNL